MKGASGEVAILNYFSRQGPLVHHAKCLPLSPPSTFLREFENCLQSYSFSLQNLVHTRTNCAVFLVVGVEMGKKWTSALALFYVSKPKRAALS